MGDQSRRETRPGNRVWMFEIMTRSPRMGTVPCQGEQNAAVRGRTSSAFFEAMMTLQRYCICNHPDNPGSNWMLVLYSYDYPTRLYFSLGREESRRFCTRPVRGQYCTIPARENSAASSDRWAGLQTLHNWTGIANRKRAMKEIGAHGRWRCTRPTLNGPTYM